MANYFLQLEEKRLQEDAERECQFIDDHWEEDTGRNAYDEWLKIMTPQSDDIEERMRALTARNYFGEE